MQTVNYNSASKMAAKASIRPLFACDLEQPPFAQMHQISVSEGPKYFSRMGYHEKGSSGPKIQTVNYTGPSVALIRCICANFKRIIAKLVFQGPFCLHLHNLRFAFMNPSFRPYDNQSLVSM